MKKEFLDYTEALELKELGFDEPCFGYYLCRNSAFGIDDLFITTEWIDLFPYDSSSCKAPTFSQAFRWFREKYRLHHNIVYLKFKKQYLTETEGIAIYFDETEYEKAELACLKKLIEIVKNKQNEKSI